MKASAVIILCLICLLDAKSLTGQSRDFIFIPHPRSDDRVKQSVLEDLEKVDLDSFEMILLGGDLTWSVSSDREGMDYCRELFHINEPNTLWTMGNHDVANSSLIREYTGRERFYSYYRDSITFLVLDTEEESSGFQSSFIHGSQLEMIRNVADTISDSHWLIILHHRLLWMVNDIFFADKLDSVGESTRQLDTTNFYQEIFPLLQKCKSRGTIVLCLGGDKTRLNIEHEREDSIFFITSVMAPEYDGSVNTVVILHHFANGKMEWEFRPVDSLDKKSNSPNPQIHRNSESQNINFMIIPGERKIRLKSTIDKNNRSEFRIYSIHGRCIASATLRNGEEKEITFEQPGIYIFNDLSGANRFPKLIFIE